VGFPLWIGHGYEKNVEELLKRLVERGQVVFDVGANIGYFTVLLASLVGDLGRVVAFEPVGSHVELLTRAIELNKLRNAFVCPKVVVDNDGEAEVTTDRLSSGLASLSPKNVPARRRTIRVQTVTLNRFSEVEGLSPDLLKIDVQGAEARVLRGATDHLCRDIRIVFEYWPTGLLNLGDDPVELLETLRAYDFRIHRIGEGTELSEIDQARFGELTRALLAQENPLASANLLASKHDVS
jgi:FkbM family methyltransferase